jgi:hypothetical protein
MTRMRERIGVFGCGAGGRKRGLIDVLATTDSTMSGMLYDSG